MSRQNTPPPGFLSLQSLRENELPDTEPGIGQRRQHQAVHDRELERKARARESGYEHIPQWGVELTEKVDALGDKFDAIHAELTKRIVLQRRVIGAVKNAAPTVIPVALTYVAGHYPQLRAPLLAFLQALGLWGG